MSRSVQHVLVRLTAAVRDTVSLTCVNRHRRALHAITGADAEADAAVLADTLAEAIAVVGRDPAAARPVS